MTNFSREVFPFRVSPSVGSTATPDFEVSTDGVVRATGAMQVAGAVSLGSTLVVTGAVSLNGATTIAGNAALMGTLRVVGMTSLEGGITFSSATAAASVGVCAAVTTGPATVTHRVAVKMGSTILYLLANTSAF